LGKIIMRLRLGLLESGMLLNFLLGRRHLTGGTFKAQSKKDEGTPQNRTNKWNVATYDEIIDEVVEVVDVESKSGVEGRLGAG
jgi:hypothetical protein